MGPTYAPLAAAAALLALAWAGDARAEASMTVQGKTTQPIGHYEFCRRNPWECGFTKDHGPFSMTPESWSAVRRIQAEVNASVHAALDIETRGVDEYWSYPDDRGDCEDYALEKRRRINVDVGIPLSSLLVTVLRRSDGQGHAVLTLRTTEGDFVLDNLRDGVTRWDRIRGYRYLKRQSTFHAGRWSAVAPSPAGEPAPPTASNAP